MCRWKFGLDYETHELVGGSEAYASKQSSASPFRIMTATTVPLAAAIAVEVTAATVVMNKSNRDNISRGAAAVLDSSSMIGANDKRHRNR